MNHILVTFIIVASITLVACQQPQPVQQNSSQTPTPTKIALELPEKIEKVEKTQAEWKAMLTELEFYVLREAGTERAFTGDLWDNKKEGVYTCRGCQLPLFTSDTKYESGTGWPSFWKPIKPEYVIEHRDVSHGMVRTEVVCGRCDGHLGHVFDDGPQPTGLRYCMNAVSMDFVPSK
ncbi:MAG: peptide-methionine (R)-S-oxide reductase MsrB [Saprospiraceae bacterium]|nr:peptide-methionine (R)-S-oxide reductase MsrB [Saprospiraceae bacterium]